MPPAKRPPDEPEQPPAEPETPPVDEPAWAANLRGAIDGLGQQLAGLKATVTDDDRRGIAEGVHELFERAGAFKPPPAQAGDGTESDGEPDPPADPPADPPPEKKTWAERLGFPKH